MVPTRNLKVGSISPQKGANKRSGKGKSNEQSAKRIRTDLKCERMESIPKLHAVVDLNDLKENQRVSSTESKENNRIQCYLTLLSFVSQNESPTLPDNEKKGSNCSSIVDSKSTIENTELVVAPKEVCIIVYSWLYYSYCHCLVNILNLTLFDVQNDDKRRNEEMKQIGVISTPDEKELVSYGF